MSVSPMMQQYLRIHESYPDCLLLFRLGDFYELFFDDAKVASRVLELTLTGKDCGLEERAPMCGVPFHSVNTYIEKLIENGYKVAVCEQMEDPALAKGLVKREVVRVLTAGTVTDPSMLGEKDNNYLLSVAMEGKTAGLAWADVSTGECYAADLPAASLRSEILRISPSELVFDAGSDFTSFAGSFPGVTLSPRRPEDFRLRPAREALLSHFGPHALAAFGLEERKTALRAAGALMRYLSETQKNSLEHLNSIQIAPLGNLMALDPSTRRNLELTDSLRGRGKKGTLLALLDHTATAMGGRLLRSWVESPLTDLGEINRRLDAVQELVSSPVAALSLDEELQGVYDLERLLAKVSYGSLNARDCLALAASFRRIPTLRVLLSGAECAALREIRDTLDPLEDLSDLLERSIDPDAPLLLSDGGFIRSGYSAALDELRDAQRNGKQWILSLESKEREATGIRNLRVQYNKVFGYYIEVTKSFLSLVPSHYIRKQTLTNAERFMTPELKEMEQRILGAKDQSVRLELRLFGEVRDAVSAAMERIQRNASAVKSLDALGSLAHAASDFGYVRPQMAADGPLSILDGRHPVVERSLPPNAFVPNDTLLDSDENRMMIITGPNMAGKSTYMRQVALICLLAQIGSFVPAREACLPVVDRIFTRIGASDDLAGGQSTFMVEMAETAYILRNATPRSLVILDEIGRGTSTFDGLAIAWAVVEYLADKEKIGAKTLFATHYHELSELEGRLEGVKNYCITVKEHGEEVLFLRKIIRGGADKSFGVQVARLAGVPRPVILRAHEIQARLQASDINQNTISRNILGDPDESAKSEQLDLFDFDKMEIIRDLQSLDVMSLTPIEAMNQLFLLRERARKS